MEQYTIYCTEEQTLKAIELGAPIEGIFIPTAEQMIGWLEEHIDEIDACKKEDGTWFYIFYPNNTIFNYNKEGFSSRKEAIIAAIDAALDYLIKEKK